MRVIDLTGQKFGRLTVLERAENNKWGQPQWLCKCDCGNEVVVKGSNLKSGHTTSCGCGSCIKTTHGMSQTPIHNTWRKIKDRCYNPNNPYFYLYGGRGIRVFEEWINDFQAFFDYVSTLEHFNEVGYTLDRIEVNSNYEPCNVRFATAKEQANNRRVNIKVYYDGEEMTLKQAAEISGIKYETLQYRYYKGLRGDEIFKPVDKRFSHKKGGDNHKKSM